MGNAQWICCQIGAREHYAVPRALHRQGRLAGLYTDFWARQAFWRIANGRWRTEGTGALAGRFHPELTGAAVVAWNWKTLGEKLKVERLETEPRTYHRFLRVGHQFATRVREELKRKLKAESGKRQEDQILFAYDTGALETFEWCKERGIRTVLGQMDPSRVEVEMVQEEAKRWPGWQSQGLEVPEEYFRRREQEWALADRVMVNSEFCRQALMRQGVPPEKLVVVPVCYGEDGGWGMEDEWPSRKPVGRAESASLRVLFLGQVILRKGIQYLVEAARLLKEANVGFEVVGPIGISREAVASAPTNVTFHGRVTRDQAKRWYAGADVFVLPTLSDGFALTQLEAMAHGLPVIATPNCGEVVTHGLDCFIVPARDAPALARAIAEYIASPSLRREHRAGARRKSELFTLARLGKNLVELEEELRCQAQRRETKC